MDRGVRVFDGSDEAGLEVLAETVRQGGVGVPADPAGPAVLEALAVATARLHAAGLPTPEILLIGEDAVRGKPAPDP